MVFASLFFIYVFFVLNLIFYTAVRNEKIVWRNGVMLVFSLIFYAFVGPKYILLLLGETLISYLCALGIGKTAGRSGRKLLLCLDIVLLLGLLGYFKYAGFLVANYNLLPFPDLKVPEIAPVVGISFYTFQLISYTVDVYREEVKPQKSYLKLLLYTSMFHQCIAGPIVRYSSVQKELNSRRPSSTDVYEGILRFSVGLAKKAVLANGVASVAKLLIPDDPTSLQAAPALSVILGIFCFTLQIYLDFSAYSDMAIGMGRMLGFHYPENFNYPYIAYSVTDFWRRWHISLSTFFRDYVYIPLGGNRKGFLRTILNLLAVWFLTGLWHGASWNYVLWGMYYFVILVIEKCVGALIRGMQNRSAAKNENEAAKGETEKTPTEKEPAAKKKIPIPLWILGTCYTMVLVIIGWGIFYFEQTDLMIAAGKSIFLAQKWYDTNTVQIFINHLFLLIVATLACFPIWKGLRSIWQKLSEKHSAMIAVGGIVDILVMAVCMLLATMALAGNTYNPFLYFRF